MHRFVNNEYELRDEATFKKDLKAIAILQWMSSARRPTPIK
ncbi:hypothetical protein HMPREF9134_00104 [Porphyromonas catoniae F0037]|uniref:Uncharacterized protein n=1 Tax=Porphyromonas catoniae F0037 TaxID=1127696 RepID=L1NIW6_9PORP|nr:hypothetical protein HMPREF9134_00104 [Porphyromonas catoniae F0037]